MPTKEYARQAARKYYDKVSANPDLKSKRDANRKAWFEANKEVLMKKQRLKKRERKLWAIDYKGGKCERCNGVFHPAVYEFHHINPEEKDRDPSKTLLLSLENMKKELDKCILVCANCHRLEHHNYLEDEDIEQRQI